MAKSTGLVESVNTFGLSWLLSNEKGTCGVLDKEIESCIPLPPDQDPCLAIMNEDIFGKVCIHHDFFLIAVKNLGDFYFHIGI